MVLLKILQITPTLHPTISFGGGSTVAWELGRALARNGNRVTIISTDAGDAGRNPSGRFVQDGMEVIRARNLSNSLAYQFKLFLPLISPTAIRREVQESDVVHLHDFRTILNLLTGQIAIDEGLPIVVQPHGTIRSDYFGRRSLKSLIDIIMGDRIASRIDAWIALSEIERDYLVQFGINQSKIHILPNGIEMGQFDNDMGKAKARQLLGVDENKRILLFIGRIHQIKGIDLLIDSMADVLKQEKDAMAIIAGPDDGALPKLKDKVREQGLSGQVIFKGIVIGEEKNRLLRAADAFVLPSKKEAFPISLLEACAAGLPIITTDNSDVARGINGICGLTVDRVINDFTEAILKIIRDKDLASRYSSAGKKHASSYSWGNIVTKYIELYQTLI